MPSVAIEGSGGMIATIVPGSTMAAEALSAAPVMLSGTWTWAELNRVRRRPTWTPHMPRITSMMVRKTGNWRRPGMYILYDWQEKDLYISFLLLLYCRSSLAKVAASG